MAQGRKRLNMNQNPTTRRAALRRCLLAAGATAVVMPGSWRKPIVDSVLLPAHAQSSPVDPVFSRSRVTSAATSTRTPSGGDATTALASIALSGCVGVAGIPVSCTLEADVGGTPVPLGTTSTTTDATGSYTLSLSIPTATVVDIAALSFISAVCTAGTTTETLVLFPSDWSAALAGSPPAPAACTTL